MATDTAGNQTPIDLCPASGTQPALSFAGGFHRCEECTRTVRTGLFGELRPHRVLTAEELEAQAEREAASLERIRSRRAARLERRRLQDLEAAS